MLSSAMTDLYLMGVQVINCHKIVMSRVNFFSVNHNKAFNAIAVAKCVKHFKILPKLGMKVW